MHMTWCPACDALVKCPEAHCLGGHINAYCPKHKGYFVTMFTADSERRAAEQK